MFRSNEERYDFIFGRLGQIRGICPCEAATVLRSKEGGILRREAGVEVMSSVATVLWSPAPESGPAPGSVPGGTGCRARGEADRLDFGRPSLYFVDKMSPRFKAPEGLAQNVADELARAIIYNELKPNQRLREEELTQRFGISRSPIREAFRILAHEGLVVFSPRRGVRVAPLSRTVIQEIYECRAVLEGFAAGMAAERARPGDVKRLKARFRAMAVAAKQHRLRGYFDQNVQLQSEIRALGRNSTLLRLLEGLGRQTLRYRYIVYATAPEMIGVSLRRNTDIIRAIERGDGAGARQLTEHLILEAGQLMVKHLPQDVAD